MTILKTGSASTLDVIDGVKALLPETARDPAREPAARRGQRPVVVRATPPCSSVIFEGVVAAALTGLMILIFLGSWRSTLIITISIPLAILASVALLAAIGETINVMTLGGLALAVGILVDDATVTIENINYHLEQGKDIESAIMDGARQIVIPATVSLLCICIVFVPMFNLGGVAGYLFRPMAEAVVFALIGSYVLSRTLVNTMARFLLAHQAMHGHGAPQPPTRNPLALFQRGFERRFEAARAFYRRLLVTALAGRRMFIVGFLVAVLVLVRARARTLARTSFRRSTTRRSSFTCARRPERASRTRREISTGSKRPSARSFPPAALDPIVDNIGLPVSGINCLPTTIRARSALADADILITIKPRVREPRRPATSRRCARRCRDQFPGTTFAFLPADIVSQILNFGLPAPIDVQIIGSNFDANHVYANKLLAKDRPGPGRCRRANPAGVQQSDVRVDVDRTRAAQVGLNEARRRPEACRKALSGSFKIAPTFWINPKNGVAYPIVAQTPQYWLDSLSSLENIPASARDGPQIVGGLATIKRGRSHAVVSHYAVQPVLDIFATNNERDLGAVSADIQKILDETANELPAGSSVVLRGQTQTMTYAYQQLFVGIALAVVLIYLLIVVNFQSWLDPFVIVSALPTALAGIVWMLFITRTTLSVPALDGRDHVHGRGDRQQHSRRQFRARAAGGGRRRRDRRDRRGLHPLPAGSHDCAGDDHRHGADGAQRRTECPAWPRGDRRARLLDRCDAFVRARGLPPRS